VRETERRAKERRNPILFPFIVLSSFPSFFFFSVLLSSPSVLFFSETERPERERGAD
jgi:hypothetical protein